MSSNLKTTNVARAGLAEEDERVMFVLMPLAENKPLDPRVRRTRQMLHTALEQLLVSRRFDELTVQDITEAATLNRATFYDHYPDKFALLECVVGDRFHQLLTQRGVSFDGSCSGAIQSIILGVCDFLIGQSASPCGGNQRLEPHLELAIVAVVRAMLLEGFRKHFDSREATPELRAATAAWAIYGAVKEWTQTPERGVPAQGAVHVWRLVAPLFGSPVH